MITVFNVYGVFISDLMKNALSEMIDLNYMEIANDPEWTLCNCQTRWLPNSASIGPEHFGYFIKPLTRYPNENIYLGPIGLRVFLVLCEQLLEQLPHEDFMPELTKSDRESMIGYIREFLSRPPLNPYSA